MQSHKGTPVRLDIDSIACEDEIDQDAVKEIVKLATHCGILYPPIVVIETEPLQQYLVVAGANTFAAAKKLKHRKEFSEQVEAYLVKEIGDAENLQEQLQLAG